MHKDLAIRTTNGGKPITIRTATGEVGIIAGDCAIYVSREDLETLVMELLNLAAKRETA
jgi:hypothetical protein